MKALLRIALSVLCFLLIFVCLVGCALNQNYIQTKDASDSEITGNYTVFLFGANHYEDIATAAMLVPTEGKYNLDIYAPEWAYRIRKDVSGKDAVAIAKDFVRWNPSSMRSRTARIVAPDGGTIGYEIRPLYMPTTYGREDVMYINYFLKNGNKVEVHIHLYPDVEQKIMTGGGRSDKGD
ncbi:MAG TPA: hypothetical protein VK452_05945 [Dissulfurispiraceae bacterium]|nr:hypothetical protein [Dissulfurispiraceae bacterium]